jgi:hypothetical protein
VTVVLCAADVWLRLPVGLSVADRLELAVCTLDSGGVVDGVAGAVRLPVPVGVCGGLRLRVAGAVRVSGALEVVVATGERTDVGPGLWLRVRAGGLVMLLVLPRSGVAVRERLRLRVRTGNGVPLRVGLATAQGQWAESTAVFTVDVEVH